MSILDYKSKLSLLFATLFSLIVPVVLFQLKMFDDNALCRWNWVFDFVAPQHIYILLVMAVSASFYLAKFPWPSRKSTTLLVFSFVICLPFWREPEIIMDASRYFSQAKYVETYGVLAFWQQWGQGVSAWTDLPLIAFLYGLIFKCFGESRLAIQVVTTLFFSGSLLVTFKLGKKLWDEEIGFIAALLLLCFPYLFVQVPLMMVDLPTMFFLLLAVYTLVEALQNGRKGWLFLAAAALFLSFFAKYSSWLFLSVHLVVFMVFWTKEPKETMKNGIIIALIALLLIGVSCFALWETMESQLGMLIEYQKPGLKRWGESFVSTFFFQTHPMVTLAVLFAVGVAWKKKNLEFVIPGFLILLVLVLQVKRIRYLMPIFPMVALAAAYGLSHIGNQRLKRFLVLSSIGASLVLAMAVYLPFTYMLSSVNIQKAGQFLDTLDGEGVQVYTVPQLPRKARLSVNVPLIDLFTDKKIYLIKEQKKSTAKRDLKTSFRFTWEQKLPPFYQESEDDDNGHSPLLVISSGVFERPSKVIMEMISRRNKVKSFTTNTGKFGYKTFVTVYYNE